MTTGQNKDIRFLNDFMDDADAVLEVALYLRVSTSQQN